MNNPVFGKTMENLRKHRDTKLFTAEFFSIKEFFSIRTKLLYCKLFHRTSIGNRNETTGGILNKPIHLVLSILELSKILMYEFWYDYVKPKYDQKAKLCYMDTNSFIVYIKTDDIYKDIAEDVETRFHTSNYEVECNSI